MTKHFSPPFSSDTADTASQAGTSTCFQLSADSIKDPPDGGYDAAALFGDPSNEITTDDELPDQAKRDSALHARLFRSLMSRGYLPFPQRNVIFSSRKNEDLPSIIYPLLDSTRRSPSQTSSWVRPQNPSMLGACQDFC